jgi:hypothetical protein
MDAIDDLRWSGLSDSQADLIHFFLIKSNEQKTEISNRDATRNQEQGNANTEESEGLSVPKRSDANAAEVTTEDQNVKQEKQQIKDFGVAEDQVEPVHGLISQLFQGIKNSGLTVAKTVGDWVGIEQNLKSTGTRIKTKRLSQNDSLFFYGLFCNFSYEKRSTKEACA